MLGGPEKTLRRLSLAYAASACIGAYVCLVAHIPAQFGGGLVHGDPAIQDCLVIGTALSPPLTVLIVQMVITIVMSRGGRLGRGGALGLALLGALYTIGQLGEPIVYRTLEPPNVFSVPSLIVLCNLAGSLALCLFGWLAVRRGQAAKLKIHDVRTAA